MPDLKPASTTPKPKPALDAIDALGRIKKILAQLSPDEQKRVLAFLNA